MAINLSPDGKLLLGNCGAASLEVGESCGGGTRTFQIEITLEQDRDARIDGLKTLKRQLEEALQRLGASD